jgi:ATP-dependent DNA helicase RecG
MGNNDLIIKNLLQQSKSERLEFSVTTSLDNMAKTITAFINTKGGDLLLGVDDNKKVLGLPNVQQLVADIQIDLAKKIVPTAPISIHVLTYEGKPLILISVWEGANKPYSYKLNFYYRNGARTVKSDSKNIEAMISDRKKADFSWERMPVLSADIDDLDFSEIKKTMDLDIEKFPNKKYIDEEDFLIKTGLMLNGNLTNACIVLFGKNPTQFIPQSKIRLTVYPSKTSTNTFLEDKWFDGNLFTNIKVIFDYLDALYGKTIKIDGLLRSEKKNYPELALREGILNAMVHRDYNSMKGFMQVSIYSNRTEISNFGGLPGDMTVADLKKEHPSIPRNPDIANTCFLRQYIEMVGSGSIRIISECKKNGFKPPQWKDDNNILTLTFPEVVHSKNEGINEGINDTISDTISDTINDTISMGVKSELAQVYRYIKGNQLSKSTDIEVHINKSNATVERYLKLLRDNKLIEYVGSRKSGGYKVLE